MLVIKAGNETLHLSGGQAGSPDQSGREEGGSDDMKWKGEFQVGKWKWKLEEEKRKLENLERKWKQKGTENGSEGRRCVKR